MVEILKERWMHLAGVLKEAHEDDIGLDIQARMEEPDVPMEVIDKLVQAKLKNFADDVVWRLQHSIENLKTDADDFERNRDPYGPHVSNNFSEVIDTLETILERINELVPSGEEE